MVEPRQSASGHHKRCYTTSVSSSSRSRSRSRGRNSRKRYRSRSRSRSGSRRHYSHRSPSTERRLRYYGTRENPDKSRVVGIFGLHPSTKEDKLLEVFSAYGAIEHISVIHDAKTGNSRGFGFVYFAQVDEATIARKECNGMTLDGKRIRVDYSITKRPHTPTPGVYMGSPRDRRSSHRHRSRSRGHRSKRSGSRRHRSRASRSHRSRHSRRRYSDEESYRYSRSYSR